MARVRILLILLVVWLAFLFNIERFDFDGASLVNLDTSFYIFIVFLCVMVLFVPALGKQNLGLSLAVVLGAYAAMYFLLKSAQGVQGSFYMFVIEGAGLVITAILIRQVTRAQLDFETAAQNFVLGVEGSRMLPLTEGEEQVNHELYRARRFERPVAIVYCTVSNVTDEETQIHLDSIKWHITKTFKRRYQQVQLARCAASLTYKNDTIVEYGEEVVLCLPETDEREAKAFAQQLSTFTKESLQVDVMIGISCFPGDGLLFEDLVQVARGKAVVWTGQANSTEGEETRKSFDEIVSAPQEKAYSPSDSALATATLETLPTRSGDVMVDPTQRLKIEQELAWVNKLAYLSPSARTVYHFVKRAIDLMFVFGVGIFALPVMLVVALVVYIDDRAPIFYTQWRTGYGGKRFKMYKFRTMYLNAKSVPVQAIQTPNGVRYVWPEKVENDPRVTRIGKILRKTSLDELPQLLNVFRGDMSLVGPRPTSWNLDMYTLHQTERLTVRPGLTGLWQVCAREATNPDERLIWDMKYIDKMSVWLDMQILYRTAAQVFKRRGL
jgi:lipopolysaccharide/colanic/teichoic acid biosynthesis glycosyltransferase